MRSAAYTKELVFRIADDKRRSWQRIALSLLLFYAVFRVAVGCLSAVTVLVEFVLSMVVGGVVFCVLFDIVLKLLEREVVGEVSGRAGVE